MSETNRMTNANHILEKKMQAAIDLSAEKGVLRRRVIVNSIPEHTTQIDVEGKRYINFSSNDYLGLNREPALLDELHKATLKYGLGSGSSPLVSGYCDAHMKLEQLLCQQTGHQAALLFNSGFSANHGLMTALFDKTDHIIADKLIHASIIDGISHSGAVLKRFIHNKVEHAETLLKKYNTSALVTESVFSMDGDCAPVEYLSMLCQKYHTQLIVDDAHGFGVINLCVAPNVQPKCNIQIITFGKALGCQGAAVLGSKQLIDYLVSHSREYIYSTALSPINACLAYSACKYIADNPELQSQLMSNIAYFKQQAKRRNIDLIESEMPIQGVIIGDPEKAVEASNQLKSDGLWVGAIRTPTVPKNTDRLRITITAKHSTEDIDQCITALDKLFMNEEYCHAR
ncbi:8-amino-7-oxononanoate synthase [Parashewanella spongiae]|nr:8-amino-7-oxononanoate synthase [Parashewanella spongiae]MCL1076723.1 8-amino-7-oxononanoate synthase [Parashewanella spongiae]